jgi:hypothetical protein
MPPGGVSAATIPSILFGDTKLSQEIRPTVLPAGLLLPRFCTFLAIVDNGVLLCFCRQPVPALRGPGKQCFALITTADTVGPQSGRTQPLLKGNLTAAAVEQH